VVRDLDQTLGDWLSMGIGPWYVLRGQQVSGMYRGQPCSVSLAVAFSNTGDLQIEVIHQEDDTPSIYTEFLTSGREGFHQLAWWAIDFESALQSAQAAGWPVVWSGGEDGGARYAYLEGPAGPASIIEIMELTDATEGMAKLVREAAHSWDGEAPIRSLLGD
jgi:glyoxalase/bleomycin resistance protein/dioxygenase superfamily protein